MPDDTALTLLLLCLASQSLLECSVINFIGVILTDTVGPGQLVGGWEKWSRPYTVLTDWAGARRLSKGQQAKKCIAIQQASAE